MSEQKRGRGRPRKEVPADPVAGLLTEIRDELRQLNARPVSRDVPAVMTLTQAAEYLQIDADRVRELARPGGLLAAARFTPKVIRIRREALDAYVVSVEQQGEPVELFGQRRAS